MEDRIIERIGVPEGTIIINQHYMALQTPDGALHLADSDEYGRYQPIQELIRLIPHNAELSDKITDNTRAILKQALLGDHPLLSYPLVGAQAEKEETMRILDVMHPQTQEDFVRTLCLIYSEGLFSPEITSYPFVCWEELRDYLRQYLDEDLAYKLSEAVRKGLFFQNADEHRSAWDRYSAALALLPGKTIDMYKKIKYLPRKETLEHVVYYAILAANSVTALTPATP